MSASYSWTRPGLRILRLERAESGLGWMLAIAAGDSETFRSAVAAIRSLPLIEREYRADERVWWLSDVGMQRLARQLREIGEALRAKDRTGEDMERDPWVRRVTADAIRRELIVPADVRAAFAALDLLPSACEELVKSGYRIAAKRAHPDTGGQQTAMIALTKAHEKALTWARRRQQSQTQGDPSSAA